MPAREHVLLSDAERATLFCIPIDPDELARRFTLEKADLDLIGERRHDRNRLGMALQFALIRHPGMTLAQVLQIEGSVPVPLIVFLARQLSLEPSVLSDYASRSQTMADHARSIAATIGVRPPVRGDIALMIASAELAAAATDAALPIATAVIEALSSANILLPMPSTIERAGIAGRARARKNAARMMVSDLTHGQIGRIDALFAEQDGARLGWLKAVPVSTKTDSVRDIVERLRIVRAIGIPRDAGARVYPNRRHQFVQEGRLSPAYLIQRYTMARRRAIIVALLIDLEARLIDAALDIADKLIGGMFRRATTMQQRRYTASSREVARRADAVPQGMAQTGGRRGWPDQPPPLRNRHNGHIRNKLRSGDIWVERSSAYLQFDSYLLSAEASAAIVAGLNMSPSADAWLAERTASLDQRLKRFAHNLSHGRLDGVRLEGGRLQITPIRTKRDLFGYIEGFYNSRRLHSALGYINPAEMERRAA